MVIGIHGKTNSVSEQIYFNSSNSLHENTVLVVTRSQWVRWSRSWANGGKGPTENNNKKARLMGVADRPLASNSKHTRVTHAHTGLK